jgi:hypothetical protein
MKETIKINYQMRKTGDPVEKKVLISRFYKNKVKPYTDQCAIPAKCDMCDGYEIEGYYARPYGDLFTPVPEKPERVNPLTLTKEERLEMALSKPKAKTKKTYRQQREARRKSAEQVLRRRKKFGLILPKMDYSGHLVADLKKELKKRKLKVGGRKDELIERLHDSDAMRREYTGEKAKDIQAIGREFVEQKRVSRSAFQRRKSARKAEQIRTGTKQREIYIPDPMARTGVRMGKLKTTPAQMRRIDYGRKDIEQIQKAVEKLEKQKYPEMTVAELRKELKAKGLKVSGTKKELIKRLS